MANKVVYLDTLEMPISAQKIHPYKPERTKKFSLVHTKLDVRFDWEKQYLYGKAWLRVHPHFYAQNVLELDAKGFDITEIAILNNGDKKELSYDYDKAVLSIKLDKLYSRTDTIEIYIDYTAKPNEVEQKGSTAITDNKGLYFINPLGEEPNKPRQIWTQGEPEANSCWFPTIDSPNQKTTQEICITVEEKFKTLSNGKLMHTEFHPKGLKTDCYYQALPHAPYLFMMAIGEYAVVKDTLWDTLAVDYYVEPEYEPYVQDIFGNTREMIVHFSHLLGVDYPWDKYAQVVVRDYVSGAMENTGAVIFGEFAQKTKRELLDESPEDVISHELFHHWFGDLVTCESWANLPLNESFATYGEYLWREHKNGRMWADMHLHNDLEAYLMEYRSGKAVDMIRFHHGEPGDMFDSHSYAKGGRILHMLRKYVGDEAFFASLRKYLLDNAYKTVEIHQLRLAFEAVTGEDLNWFFNQWFLSSGHPEIEINYNFDSLTNEQIIHLEQVQNTERFPQYKLPMEVDVYYSKTEKERFKIELDSMKQSFRLPVRQKPLLVNLDAEKMLLAKVSDNKNIANFVLQYDVAPLFRDKCEALEMCAVAASSDSSARETVFKGLEHAFWAIQLEALSHADILYAIDSERTSDVLSKLSLYANKSEVRAKAMMLLIKLSQQPDLYVSIFERAIYDSSYTVASTALEALAAADREKAYEKALELQHEKNQDILLTCAAIFAETGNLEHKAFFQKLDQRISGVNRLAMYAYLGYWTLQSNAPDMAKETIAYLEGECAKSSPWFVRYYAIDNIKQLEKQYTDKTITNEGEEKLEFEKVVDEAKAALQRIKSITKDKNLQYLFD